MRLVYLLLYLSLLLACSKNKQAEDKQAPVIQLLSPSNNQVFTAGQTVLITGNIADNIKLAELHVHISNNNTAQLLIDIHRYPNSPAYSLSESFQVQAGITYKIQVIAVDNSGNQGMESILVTGN